MPRIEIYTGNYGSGKTEIALDRAFASPPPVSLVDLDIVNPYFRSSEHARALREAGVRVYAPTFAGTAVDIPALPADVYSVFRNKNQKVIFDVGGDPTGAAALGRFFPYFQNDDFAMYFVVNLRRPFSSNEEAILELIGAIEARARLPVSGLINNTNLQDETTPADVLDGQRVLEMVSEKKGVPIVAIYAQSAVLEKLPDDFRKKYGPLLLPLSRRMRVSFI